MIAAVMMVRDEADVIAHTIRHLQAEGVDLIVAADNQSTDDTRSILESFDNIIILDDPEPGYYQAQKMTRLAGRALCEGADWVLPCDADEVFYDPTGLTIAEWVKECTADVVRVWGWDHIATHADPNTDNPFADIQHRRVSLQTFPKVMFRADPSARLAMGNHDVDRAGSRVDGLAYRHFQYRTLDQMTRKLRQGRAAYEATDLPEYEGAHWRVGGALSDCELADAWYELCHEHGLVLDPAPVRA